MTPAPYIVGPMQEGDQGVAGIYLIPKELMRPLGNPPTCACHHSILTAYAPAIYHVKVAMDVRTQCIPL